MLPLKWDKKRNYLYFNAGKIRHFFFTMNALQIVDRWFVSV